MEEEQRDSARVILGSELQPLVAAGIVDRKLRRRILTIATGDPSFEQSAAPAPAESQEAADEAPSAGAESHEPPLRFLLVKPMPSRKRRLPYQRNMSRAYPLKTALLSRRQPTKQERSNL